MEDYLSINSSAYYPYYNFTDPDSYADIISMPYPGEVKHIPLWEIIIKCYVCAMIIFFSLVGNTLIIIVVMRHKRMRTTTNFYIVNLAIADILVTLFCTWVHLVKNLNDDWVLGSFFCKFNSFCQVMCLVASVSSLTLIAYDRFFGIVYALKAHMTNRKARTSLIIVWLFSCAVASPLLKFRELKERFWLDHTEKWCDDAWPVAYRFDEEHNRTMNYIPGRTVYFTVISGVLYFIPMIAMTIAYSVIIYKLYIATIPGERVDKGISNQQKTKKKVIGMLITILIVFGICWMPCQIVLLYSELRTNREPLGEWFFRLQFVANLLAFSNSAFNPVIYAGFNENFKQGLSDIWGIVSCKKKPNRDPKTYGDGGDRWDPGDRGDPGEQECGVPLKEHVPVNVNSDLADSRRSQQWASWCGEPESSGSC